MTFFFFSEIEEESQMTFVQKTKKKIRGMLYKSKPGKLS